MATGMVLTVAQTLFAAMDSKLLKEVCSMFGYKSQLEDLKDTVISIEAVLLDADLKQHHEPLSHATQDWINKLKDTLYDVDDLLDEFNTFTLRHKLMAANDSMISQKVRRFFSRSNEFVAAFNMSRDMKKIKKKLDVIANNRSKYGFDTNCQPRRREETISCVYKEKIIGRHHEKEEIVSILMDTNVDKRVSYVTVVGMGGLGKTTLARLVYNDDRIISMFQLRLWVCVSEDFSMKSILGKMLSSVTDQSCDQLGPDQLQKKIQDEIGGKKYLLVLDDVWEESRYKWVELIEFLDLCGRGSKIVVTTRSKDVAKAIGNGPMHELQGLSNDDSWQLFKQMAIGEEEEEHVDPNLVDIGKDIVKKCGNVPLSIKVLGAFLFGQDIKKWSLFQNTELSKIQKANDLTMATLKFSYFHLTPQLKSCFSYCALFPKDYDIKKEKLMELWMANGCIVLESDEVRCIEDIGEEYFSILLHRCFFQDIRLVYDEIFSCKVHDLMHDLALEVTGHESFMLTSLEMQLNEKVRHVLVDFFGGIADIIQEDYLAKTKTLCSLNHTDFFLNEFLVEKKMRPALLSGLSNLRSVSASNLKRLISNCKCLRLLDLSDHSLTSLPSAIGGLIHLRCLNLSFNVELEMLPKSITKLVNLQILNLHNCSKLKELPEPFSRLVNLRHLDISYCEKLGCMPRGLKNLTCLHRLTHFKVSGNSTGGSDEST